MNKVTQSIYKKKVDDLENDVNELKGKKLYNHIISIRKNNLYCIYITLCTSNSEMFTFDTLRQYLVNAGIKSYLKAVLATGWTYDDFGSGLVSITGAYAPNTDSFKLNLALKNDTGTFVVGTSGNTFNDTVVNVI